MRFKQVPGSVLLHLQLHWSLTHEDLHRTSQLLIKLRRHPPCVWVHIYNYNLLDPTHCASYMIIDLYSYTIYFFIIVVSLPTFSFGHRYYGTMFTYTTHLSVRPTTITLASNFNIYYQPIIKYMHYITSEQMISYTTITVVVFSIPEQSIESQSSISLWLFHTRQQI